MRFYSEIQKIPVGGASGFPFLAVLRDGEGEVFAIMPAASEAEALIIICKVFAVIQQAASDLRRQRSN